MGNKASTGGKPDMRSLPESEKVAGVSAWELRRQVAGVKFESYSIHEPARQYSLASNKDVFVANIPSSESSSLSRLSSNESDTKSTVIFDAEEEEEAVSSRIIGHEKKNEEGSATL